MVFEEILIFMAGDKTLNSKSMYNRCKIPRLSVMVGEEEKESVVMTEYDTTELESEISNLRNQLRKADSVNNPQASKRKKRWHFYSKWKRKRKSDHIDKEDLPSDQVKTESQPQKRPRTKSDSEGNEVESPEDDKQKEEEKPSRSNNLKLYSICTHKPILSFSSKPTTFKSDTVPNEVKKNPPKKYPAKAKKNQTKTVGKETTTSNRITNYFLGSAAGADETHLEKIRLRAESKDQLQ